jgi:hypothetical protein
MRNSADCTSQEECEQLTWHVGEPCDRNGSKAHQTSPHRRYEARHTPEVIFNGVSRGADPLFD